MSKLKIVIQRPIDSEAHARTLVQKIHEADAKNTYEPKPRGVAHYAAVMPEVCDDCGETYWTRAGRSWTSHIGCPGTPPKGGTTGF